MLTTPLVIHKHQKIKGIPTNLKFKTTLLFNDIKTFTPTILKNHKENNCEACYNHCFMSLAITH